MLNFDQLEGRPVLTEREHQILELVAIGLSAKEVAQQITIAPRTVERHIENIRLKMRARNRTHMVTCAAMSGLLTAHARHPDTSIVQSVDEKAAPAFSRQFTLQRFDNDSTATEFNCFGGNLHQVA
jgi:LuxR family transcriptional regulator, transcriptional regulator of spore coat protein